MKWSEFLAEVKTSLRRYDNSGLLDDISIKIWVENEMKRFGSLIMTVYREVLPIEKGQAKFTYPMWMLNAMYLCDTDENEPYIGVVTDAHNIKHYLFDIPSLTKGTSSDRCSTGCVNKTSMSDYHAIIGGRSIMFNFVEGEVYVEYIGLPTDEDGELEIPDTQHSRLYEYLLNYVKAKVIEDLLVNQEIEGGADLFKLFDAKAREQFGLAMTEIKANLFNPQAMQNYRNSKRKQMLKFELK